MTSLVLSFTTATGSAPGQTVTAVSGAPGTEDLTSLAEPALIAAAVAGRPGAFDQIVARHQRDLYQLCYRYVGTHEDAADLTQETFVRAYRGLARFAGASALRTWLYRIATNVCLTRVSQKRPQTEPLDARPHADDRAESAPARLEREEREARLRAAVATLPAKQRAAVVLRMWHDLSHQEVAEVLGISEGAAKANVFHAIRSLRRLLATEAIQ